MFILTDWECKHCGAGLAFIGGMCIRCGRRQNA
nr:MAG TPA: zinc finger Ran-binding domain-containing protein [Caudoviricetes sp.]